MANSIIMCRNGEDRYLVGMRAVNSTNTHEIRKNKHQIEPLVNRFFHRPFQKAHRKCVVACVCVWRNLSTIICLILFVSFVVSSIFTVDWLHAVCSNGIRQYRHFLKYVYNKRINTNTKRRSENIIVIMSTQSSTDINTNNVCAVCVSWRHDNFSIKP